MLSVVVPTIVSHYSPDVPVIEGTSVSLVCSFEYQGLWSPQLTWRTANSSLKLQPSITRENGKLHSTVQVMTRFDLHGSVFRCKATFNNIKKKREHDLSMPGETADNIPHTSGQLFVESQVLNVLCEYNNCISFFYLDRFPDYSEHTSFRIYISDLIIV